MQMQGMPTGEMHNTFWRKQQALVTFHSATPLISRDGINQGERILEELNLPFQLQQLNSFLAENGVNYTLNFYQSLDDDSPEARPSRGPQRTSGHGRFRRSHSMGEERSHSSGAGYRGQSGFNPPPGVYLFGLKEPIQSDFGLVATSIATFLTFTPDEAGQPTTGAGDDGDGQEPPENQSPVVRIVNALNKGLKTLNGQQSPVSAASPNWVWSGTPYIPQGCPLTPPIPVVDACSFWHFRLPLLSPTDLRSMTGEGVTVFVLDTLPDLDVIENATSRAGDDNLLLFDVSRNVTFNYDVWNYWEAHTGDPTIPALAVGKDVYGRHYAFKMPDHGLFIAGIVHDIAPHARVECVRVMNNYAVGDSNLFLDALFYIQNRMLPGGDLYQRPVVINLSNVTPTIAEAKAEGLDPSAGVPYSILLQIYQTLLALAEHGAIITASAGNEADLREDSTAMRPPALYPAAFGDLPPINGFPTIQQVIPVGAVDKDNNATSYSCYPGSRGIATYGGEVPAVDPADPPSTDPDVTVCDAIRGIYSGLRYPALSKDAPADPYKAPNQRGWASWVGTSFATPIISAVAARVLELQLKTGESSVNAPNVIMNAGGGTQTLWNDLDPVATGVPGGSTTGPVLLAIQECLALDEEDDA